MQDARPKSWDELSIGFRSKACCDIASDVVPPRELLTTDLCVHMKSSVSCQGIFLVLNLFFQMENCLTRRAYRRKATAKKQVSHGGTKNTEKVKKIGNNSFFERLCSIEQPHL